MRLISYLPATDTTDGLRLGAMAEDGIAPLEQTDLTEVLSRGNEYLDHLIADSRNRISKDAVRIFAPVARPQKILGIGLNYRDHAAETGMAVPRQPVVFAKYPSSVIGPGEPIRLPSFSDQVDYEAELGVVIGKPARDVSVAAAANHVFGYLNLNDVSARDLQFGEGGQWTIAKSLDTFTPMGPYLVTADEIADPQSLGISCRINGELLQDSSTDQMVFNVSELVSYLSRAMTLTTGDVIATGTPPGVGMSRNPPRFLRAGDEVTVAVQGLGELSNPVVAASAA